MLEIKGFLEIIDILPWRMRSVPGRILRRVLRRVDYPSRPEEGLQGLVEVHRDLEEKVPHREVAAKETGRFVPGMNSYLGPSYL